MPADLDARLLAPMHSLGFFCADGYNHLNISRTPAAVGRRLENLQPRHVSSATLTLQLKQKCKQVRRAASFCGRPVADSS